MSLYVYKGISPVNKALKHADTFVKPPSMVKYMKRNGRKGKTGGSPGSVVPISGCITTIFHTEPFDWTHSVLVSEKLPSASKLS